jgi:hypothetical protein
MAGERPGNADCRGIAHARSRRPRLRRSLSGGWQVTSTDAD